MNRLLITLLIATLLSACGGGSGGGGDGHHDDGPENTTRLANGVWRGSIISDASADRDLTLLVLDGLVAGVSYDSSSLFSGYMLGADDFLSGDMTEFDAVGEPVEDIPVEGFFHPDDSMDLFYRSAHDQGTIELDIDPITFEPAGMSILAGHYQDQLADIDLLITEFGELDGSDAQGCLYDGHVRAASDGSNLYEMIIARTGCADEANISALATHYGQGVVDVFVLDSNEHMELWEVESD